MQPLNEAHFPAQDWAMQRNAAPATVPPRRLKRMNEYRPGSVEGQDLQQAQRRCGRGRGVNIPTRGHRAGRLTKQVR